MIEIIRHDKNCISKEDCFSCHCGAIATPAPVKEHKCVHSEGFQICLICGKDMSIKKEDCIIGFKETLEKHGIKVGGKIINTGKIMVGTTTKSMKESSVVCSHPHCKCLNLDGQCHNFHYAKCNQEYLAIMNKAVKEINWRENLMDKFCVMFERAHREDGSIESGDYWAEKMEIFIENLLAETKRNTVDELLENIKEYHKLGKKAYNANSWDAGLHDVLFQIEKDFIKFLQGFIK